MNPKKQQKKLAFLPKNLRPPISLPSGYSPHVCADKELLNLLGKIEVTPQKEVASLQEWNKPMDLDADKNLREHLICDMAIIPKIKYEGIGCLLLSYKKKFSFTVTTAIKWAFHLNFPVVTVPQLDTIMKDRIGIQVEMVAIKKNPQMQLFKTIVKTVSETAKNNPVVVRKKVPKKKGALKPAKQPYQPPKRDPNAPAPTPIIVNYTKFCPLLDAGDANQLRKLLLRLPYLHVGRSTSWDNTEGQTFTEIRTQLIFDQTPICALIKRKCAGCVVIGADRFDKLNMKKLVHICLLEKIPVLVMPRLSQTMKMATALPTSAIAIFKYATDPLLLNILNMVRSLRSHYRCPAPMLAELEGYRVNYGLIPGTANLLKALNGTPPVAPNANDIKADPVEKMEVNEEDVKEEVDSFEVPEEAAEGEDEMDNGEDVEMEETEEVEEEVDGEGEEVKAEEEGTAEAEMEVKEEEAKPEVGAAAEIVKEESPKVPGKV